MNYPKEFSMVRKAFLLLVVIAAFALMTGCTVSNIAEVSQPEKALPSSSFNVYIFDVILIYDTVAVLNHSIVTDSTVVAAALPSGWSVNSAAYAIDQNFYHTMNNLNIEALTPDTTLFNHMRDSLIVAGKGRTCSRAASYDADLQAFCDSANTKDQFLSYAGNVGLNVPAGTHMDTLTEDTSGTVDSLYLKYMACIVKLNVSAGSTLDSFALGYFVGFDSRNLDAGSLGSSIFNAYSDSNMILITNDVYVDEAPLVLNRQYLDLSVSPNPLHMNASLSYYIPRDLASSSAMLKVFDVSGKLHYAGVLPGKPGWNAASWSPVSGNANLPNGSYIMKLESGSKSITRRVLILK